jgi:hypothetical protein
MPKSRCAYACILAVFLSLLLFLLTSTAEADARPLEPDDFNVTADLSGTSSNPVIDVWYGSHQVFGQIGNPQQWVNVLGNVSDPHGIASLTYSLNGGAELPLSVGSDSRRLASEGDFNVEIAYTELVSGSNRVVITATDELNNTAVETVTVEYASGNVWPMPYAIDWSSVITISDAAQVVDGLWALEAGGLRPVVMAYDRIVAIGDLTWDDFEVTVPITIHAIDPAGFSWPSVAPGLGIMMRWSGHTNSPVVCSQPHCGWRPFGATTWYGWDDPDNPVFKLEGNNDVLLDTDPSVELVFDTCYNFKMRVETVPGQGGFYGFKVWQDGQVEPSEWNLTGQQGLSDPQSGSFLLVAHHVDVTFGDVTVVPVSDTTAPVISNIQVITGQTTAMITWTTDEPATSTVAYGETPTYENGNVNDDTFVTQHTIVLPDLVPETAYHYQITSADGSGNAASSTDRTFTTSSSSGSDPSGIVSDDFNACTLNTGLWTFIDPLGDATWAMTGTHTQDAWISISVPKGNTHELWTDGAFAPRVMQLANNVNFEVEARFESEVTEQYQMQGIMVEQDGDDFLRLEFYSDGANTRAFVASFADGSVTIHNDTAITGGAPITMRVKREGDLWTQSYAVGGQSWTTIVGFSQPLTVTAVGVYAGNAGTNSSNAPAHTGLIDYFFNAASPIVPEDKDRNTLAVSVIGSGTVAKDPDKSTYACGDTVALTATASPGWSFAGWSGDLAGEVNPATLVMTGSQVVTATFIQDEYVLTVNRVGSGSVAVDPSPGPYHYGDVVTLMATADPHWTFAGWSGGLSGADNPATTTIIDHTTVTATFTQVDYMLTVNRVGNGSVAVDLSPGPYHYGDVVTLTATADPHWTFANWSGALSGAANPATTTITGHTAVTATFNQVDYTLTVNRVGNGSVAVDPSPGPFHYGDVVTLTATADPGWTFAGWSGGLSGADNPATTTITGHTTVTATFTQLDYTLTVDRVGDGSVAVDPSPGPYHYGDVVTLTATADPGWTFAGWSGGLSGADNPATTTITGHTTVTATFTQVDYTLTVNRVGNGSVAVDPGPGPYHYGDVVTLTATAGPGWSFDSWDGDLTDGGNPVTITMTSNRVVTAKFVAETTTHCVMLPLIVQGSSSRVGLD